MLRHAIAEAQATGQPAVDSGHVLLALLRPPTCPVLEAAGITPERARSHILGVSVPAGAFARHRDRPDARAFLVAASQQAQATETEEITLRTPAAHSPRRPRRRRRENAARARSRSQRRHRRARLNRTARAELQPPDRPAGRAKRARRLRPQAAANAGRTPATGGASLNSVRPHTRRALCQSLSLCARRESLASVPGNAVASCAVRRPAPFG